MKTCVVLGSLPEKMVAELALNGFAVVIKSSEIDFLLHVKGETPFFSLVEIGLISFDSIHSMRENGTPVIAYTPSEPEISGVEYVKAGAIDYLSLKSNDFVSKSIDSVNQFLSTYYNSFVHRVLKDSEKLYFSIIEEAPVSILICSLEGQIVIANNEATKFMELLEEDSIVQHLDPVLQEEFLKIMQEVGATGDVQKIQCSIQTKELELIPVSWRISKFDHILQGTLLVYGADISDYEEIRKKESFKTKSLLSMNERLARANKSLDQFSSMISHDLKNGLNRIQGLIRILSRKEELSLSVDGKELIEKVNLSTSDMVDTINRILDFAKSKGSDIEIRSFSLNSLINRLISEMQNQLNEINGTVQLIAEKDIVIEADLICIKQVFENLLSNAIKYRHPDRNLVLKISLDDMGADVCISFDDNGLGVKPDDNEKIFETYFRDADLQGKIEGHGIGLSTVKTLLEAHGGMIWVDTDNPIGATFNVQLPKKQ